MILVCTALLSISYIDQPLLSVGGSPPFNADGFTLTNTNEPYLDFLDFMSSQNDIPQTLTTSYGDDEQTVSLSSYLEHISLILPFTNLVTIGSI